MFKCNVIKVISEKKTVFIEKGGCETWTFEEDGEDTIEAFECMEKNEQNKTD